MSGPARTPEGVLQRRPSTADYVLVAAGLVLSVLVSLGYTLAAGGGDNPLSDAWVSLQSGPTIFAVVLGAIEVVALLWRRVLPGTTAAIVAVCALGHLVLGLPLLAADFAVPVALYSVTAYGSVWAGRLALGGAISGALVLGLVAPEGFTRADAVGFLFFLLGAAISVSAWALGLARRSRVMHREVVSERESRRDRIRAQEERLAAQAERTRIAREMHDIVAHSLSVMIAQADGGRYAVAQDPDAATRALATVSETGRAALTDMRRILGVLRAEDIDDPMLAPQPDDTDIGALVSQVRDTMPVSFVEMGRPRQLPPGIGATLYRITQEALTNILKHAGPDAKATVSIQWSPRRVSVQVDDDGRGAASTAAASGHGVLGMRERADMLGGTLVAGPRPGGGYRVRADIPLPSVDSTLSSAPVPQPTPVRTS